MYLYYITVSFPTFILYTPNGIATSHEISSLVIALNRREYLLSSTDCPSTLKSTHHTRISSISVKESSLRSKKYSIQIFFALNSLDAALFGYGIIISCHHRVCLLFKGYTLHNLSYPMIRCALADVSCVRARLEKNQDKKQCQNESCCILPLFCISRMK